MKKMEITEYLNKYLKKTTLMGSVCLIFGTVFFSGCGMISDTTNDINDAANSVHLEVEHAKDELESAKNELEGAKNEVESALNDAKDEINSAVENASGKIEEASKKINEKESESSFSEHEEHYTFRNDRLLEQHYEKHGEEMGFTSSEEYEEAACDVINNPNALHKYESEDNDIVYYVEETNELVIVSEDGYIRTYFEPSDGIRYYNRQ